MMAARFCSQCGSPSQPGDQFCRVCGHTMTEAERSLGSPGGPSLDPWATSPSGYAPPDPFRAPGPSGPLSVGDALSFGFNTVTKDPVRVIGLIFVGMLIAVAPSLLGSFFQGSDPASAFISLIFSIAGIATGTIAGIGIVNVCLKLANGQQPEFNDLFEKMSLFWNYLGGSFLIGLCMLPVGFLVFFLILGIIAAAALGSAATAVLLVLLIVAIYVTAALVIWLVFGMYTFLIVDRSLGPIKALKASARITKGSRLTLFLLGLVSLALIIGGLIVLFIGILFTGPVVALAWTSAYRHLVARADPRLLDPATL